MKYTLYKNDKFIMQRKHFYPLKMYLIKTFGIEVESEEKEWRKEKHYLALE